MSELTTAVASIAAVTVLGQAVTLGALLDILGQNPHARLVFAVSGRETSSGYHITEVKSGAFTALDCGANAEAWTETFIQLWDVPADPGSQPMTAGKATSLLGIVEARIGLDRAGSSREPGRPARRAARSPRPIS